MRLPAYSLCNFGCSSISKSLRFFHSSLFVVIVISAEKNTNSTYFLPANKITNNQSKSQRSTYMKRPWLANMFIKIRVFAVHRMMMHICTYNVQRSSIIRIICESVAWVCADIVWALWLPAFCACNSHIISRMISLPSFDYLSHAPNIDVRRSSTPQFNAFSLRSRINTLK